MRAIQFLNHHDRKTKAVLKMQFVRIIMIQNVTTDMRKLSSIYYNVHMNDKYIQQAYHTMNNSETKSRKFG